MGSLSSSIWEVVEKAEEVEIDSMGRGGLLIFCVRSEKDRDLSSSIREVVFILCVFW